MLLIIASLHILYFILAKVKKRRLFHILLSRRLLENPNNSKGTPTLFLYTTMVNRQARRFASATISRRF